MDFCGSAELMPSQRRRKKAVGVSTSIRVRRRKSLVFRDNRLGVVIFKPKQPVVQLAGREPVRSTPADFQQSQDGNGGVEGRKLFGKAPVLRVESVPWIKSIDDEDIAIDEDQSGPLSRTDPFPAKS